MALCDPAFALPSVMNDRHQPVSIPANVEDHVSIYIIGVFEDFPHLYKHSPSRHTGNSEPGSNLACRVRIPLFSFE